MRTITLAHSQDNIAFLSTNILNVLFPNFILLFFVLSYYIFFRSFDLFIISSVEDCISGSQKLVFFMYSCPENVLGFLTCFSVDKLML